VIDVHREQHPQHVALTKIVLAVLFSITLTSSAHGLDQLHGHRTCRTLSTGLVPSEPEGSGG
jgi:hypothetical protein